MISLMETLKPMTYPGRIIIAGAGPAGEQCVLYAITGRSPSSQARRLEIDAMEQKIFVRPTDEETLRTGNPDLLVYEAIMCGKEGLAVSNGKQTTDVFAALRAGAHAAQVLHTGLAGWEYEPDEPNWTPRISGCITDTAALSVLKRAGSGGLLRNTFEFPLIAGQGRMVATYTGENANPLPSFAGEPRLLALPFTSAQEAAEALYEALAPIAGEPDFRVAAAAAMKAHGGSVNLQVKNRHAQ
jgi:IMP cyclohydrolase